MRANQYLDKLKNAGIGVNISYYEGAWGAHVSGSIEDVLFSLVTYGDNIYVVARDAWKLWERLIIELEEENDDGLE